MHQAYPRPPDISMVLSTHQNHLETCLLEAAGIEKHFGGVHALRGARVEVHAGEVHALVGENGAGKSTLGKILAGVHKPDAGTLFLHGREIAPTNPLEAQRMGIGIIFQELDLFPNLSIAENIVARNLHFKERFWIRRNRLSKFCRPYMEQVGLTLPDDRLVGDLSMGQMQLVAIARALSMQVRILVMDESTSALTDNAVENLFGVIRKMKQSGVAIIYVSHKMDEIFRIADRVTILRDGQ
ncbi:MAG: ATP-binding cassette domain-containing protein, partial [Verrucomicrobia bacterium]|nr:ATP-binding cassette domain-containing protein [Verrucomicrobiota bacterium]